MGHTDKLDRLLDSGKVELHHILRAIADENVEPLSNFEPADESYWVIDFGGIYFAHRPVFSRVSYQITGEYLVNGTDDTPGDFDGKGSERCKKLLEKYNIPIKQLRR